jgi:tRNA uridine 5-carboxymethylaminomethyl modification enzyme
MGFDGGEIYLQGFSTSMPPDVQYKMLRSLKGFENAEIMRYAYAIEYDCANPLCLLPTLEFKAVKGLYGAGQINGTSGYEEAAVQGLIAGINASAGILDDVKLVLPRHSSYIGTLIDDLVTKGTNEPYRIMTSRSEYRLLLRQDNADTRLCDIAHKYRLINDERYSEVCEKRDAVKREIERTNKVTIPPSELLSGILENAGSSPVDSGIKLSSLLKRPELDYEKLTPLDSTRPDLPPETQLSAQIEIKYEGYIKKQEEDAERAKRLESAEIPSDTDYATVKGLRIEAMQKLTAMKPENIGRASRISGVSPADISVLMIYLGL